MPVVIHEFEAVAAPDAAKPGGGDKPQSEVALNAAAAQRLRELARRHARLRG